ncbi:putative cysteine--tRNA ligase, mitochondrial [Chionoecetes opilio]|uniref:cysteine--tRNA ligase n=1 Tax=Chionoecetes opilio TaxID=41210 RepID=A0A8J5D147_CHIOP|nr:putative cysteine--tRNA ligase, mitochondrial [Chionoecetes opilio]
MSSTRCMGCLALRRLSPLAPHRQRVPVPLSGGCGNVLTPLRIRMGKRWSSSASWALPDGHETGINIYNSTTRTKVPLRTVHPGLLTWYNCGPTVYDSAHLGHALCYVKIDIVRRIMTRVFDLNVIMVMGITDIDDKIIKRSKELGVSYREVTEHYEQEFFSDMDRLRVWRPSLAPRVTEHVTHVVAFTQGIMDRGLAYVATDGTVCFDTGAYGRYGKLFPLDVSIEAAAEAGGAGGARGAATATAAATAGNKKSPRDFALWKVAKEGEPSWPSPWGRGRPGWHIECSAMASHILGMPLDLHAGGKDLLFPHHENEEAQCCAYHDTKQWCNYWLHVGHLHTRGTEKMSKSLANTISVGALMETHSVNTFRLYCLLSHYRTDVEYTPTSLDQAKAYMRRLRSFLHDAYAYINGQLKCAPLDEAALKMKLVETRSRVKWALADDFDTVRAVEAVMELISLGNRELKKQPQGTSISRSAGSMAAICSYIHYLMDDVFGIHFPSVSDASSLSLESGGRLFQVMNAVVELRDSVRKFALMQNTPVEGQCCQREQSTVISINQSMGHTPGGVSPHPPYDATPGGHHARVPMQAPFPYQAALDKKHQLAPATSLVGDPLASSTPDCLLQIQPDGKDRFQGSVPHAHIAEVGVDGLCR